MESVISDSRSGGKMKNKIDKSNNDLNNTPSSRRIHISFFGRINAGKSSVVNAITGQDVSIVSDTRGTTTDPVKRAMEIFPLGPVLIIDTPGIDDSGEIGEMRIKSAGRVMAKTDIAVLVVDSFIGLSDDDEKLISAFRERKIPFCVVFNKIDLDMEKLKGEDKKVYDFPTVSVSTYTGEGLDRLVDILAKFNDKMPPEPKIISDIVPEGSTAILVTPIDSSAPKGRLILPQVQTIRDLIDGDCNVIVTEPDRLKQVLDNLKEPPFVVITDSQVFPQVNRIVPENIYLTSFSILFARFNGILFTAVSGALTLKTLKEGDTILISEGCTHHKQCDDIGSVKLPKWIEKYTGKKFKYQFTSGEGFPEDLSPYKLIVHCGGCMLNSKEMTHRMKQATKQMVPFTNYGTLIAHMNGILTRSTNIFHITDKN